MFMDEEKIVFECNNDNTKGLLYEGLSIIFMQIFSIEFPEKKKKKKNNNILKDPCIVFKSNELSFVKKDEDAIDRQIFINPENDRPVNRYKLEGFDFEIKLDDPYDVTIKGHMFVEMSLFFNKTISLSYRMVIDGNYVTSTGLLTTDHLISIVSLALSAEHWSINGEGTKTNINLEIEDISVNNLFINCEFEWHNDIKTNCESLDPANSSGNVLKEVFKRYKECVLRMCNDVKYSPHEKKRQRTFNKADMLYAYVDIWENVKHYDDLFGHIKEEEIISHIHDYHKRELVGLMSLYPAEWPYRTVESYEDVCGENIAIDSDDLILVNQNICVVFGTYGLRGGKDAAVDWKEHLRERVDYHVSWPEYLLILEMVLAKKYTISYAKDILLESVLCEDAFENPSHAIEDNAALGLKITQLLMKLDAVKYSKFVSHKIMFDRTRKRLSIDEDTEKLENTMERVDNSLQNIRETKSLKQGTLLNIVLGGVSVGALFQIIFMETRIPFLHSLGFQSEKVGFSLIGVTIFLIFTGLMTLLIYLVNTSHNRRK